MPRHRSRPGPRRAAWPRAGSRRPAARQAPGCRDERPPSPRRPAGRRRCASYPEWKSPCTMVSGRPHSSSRGNRLSSPRAAATSAALSSLATSPSSSAAICPVMTGARRSANPGGRHPGARRAGQDRLVGQDRLGGDQVLDRAGDDLRRRVPAVLTGQVLEQDPPWPGTDDRRHQGRVRAGECGDDAGLVGREAGRGLQPDRAVVGGQPEQRGQVPGLACSAAPVTRRPAAPSVPVAQVSTSLMPSSQAHGERSSSGPFRTT